MTDTTHAAPVVLPRIAITYCTQCKWLLRAAYFGQELLSTFGTTIGEIALIPATGGLFTVYLTHKPEDTTEVQEVLIWDRKAEGGFPETKILKQKVRNHISPEKKLGHSDTPSLKGSKPDALTTGDTADSVSALGTTSGAAGNDPLIAGAVATTNEDGRCEWTGLRGLQVILPQSFARIAIIAVLPVPELPHGISDGSLARKVGPQEGGLGMEPKQRFMKTLTRCSNRSPGN
ncbi:hypothetical protein LTR33_012038 [Friedmanniomyces endolithicus]|nr:hypothetical protein LTR33_012038 [Friedmanniomyces endolithicus]